MRHRILLLPLLLLLAAFAVACGSEPNPDAPTITADVLVEPSQGDARWFNDVSVADGTDGYELLEAAVDDDLEADWFPEFQSHFVKSILGAAPEGSQFWGAFLWNSSTSTWEPLPFGADLLSVKEGHVVGWALIEYNPDDPQVPTSTP